MTYHLGIDLGTTFTAAAVARPDGQVQMAGLGDHGTAVPSVLHLRADGSLLVGDPAIRRATEEPDRVARESKRRVGDTTPLVLGGTPVSAELLQGRLARWVVDRVAEREGAWPTSIAVTHPASWGEYKLDLLRGALRQVDLGDARLLPEPVAAATAYAVERDLPAGTTLAVYDLGGGTFDACVLRRDADGHGFEVAGSPEGVDRLGGIDFDEAIFAHVRAAVGPAVDALPDDASSRAAIAHLRGECRGAKHALSADSDATIAVLLPDARTEVRLTRTEFEAMVRPALVETVVALRRALRSADVEPDGLAAVLLVGGSSRIPLVSQMVATELGRPVVVDAHPKDAIALGAAITARDAHTAASSPDWRLPPPTVPAEVVEPTAPPRTPGAIDAPTPVAAPSPGTQAKGRRALVAGGVVLVAALAGVGFLVLGGDDGDGGNNASDTADTVDATDDSATDETIADTTTSGDPDGGDADGNNPLLAFDDYTDEAAAAWQTICTSSPSITLALGDDPEGGCLCVFEGSRDADVAYADFAELGGQEGSPEILGNPAATFFQTCSPLLEGDGSDPFGDIFGTDDTTP